MFRNANMARYLSNSGNWISNNEAFKVDIADSETSSGFVCPERSLEVGGAGSMEVYILPTECGWVSCLYQRHNCSRNYFWIHGRGQMFFALFWIVPLYLRDCNFTSLSNSPFRIRGIFLQYRDRSKRWDSSHRFGSLPRTKASRQTFTQAIEELWRTSCLTIGSSVLFSKTFSRTGRAELSFICPRQ